jgi:hypothetical protein
MAQFKAQSGAIMQKKQAKIDGACDSARAASAWSAVLA